MARTKNYLRRTGVCEEVHHKEQYVARAELEGAWLAHPCMLAPCRSPAVLAGQLAAAEKRACGCRC